MDQWSIEPSRRFLFDNGTDFAVLSHAFVTNKIYEDSKVNLSSGVRSDKAMPIEAKLCDGVTLVCKLTGAKYILKYRYAIDHTNNELQESLLQPLHIQLSGNDVLMNFIILKKVLPTIYIYITCESSFRHILEQASCCLNRFPNPIFAASLRTILHI